MFYKGFHSTQDQLYFIKTVEPKHPKCYTSLVFLLIFIYHLKIFLILSIKLLSVTQICSYCIMHLSGISTFFFKQSVFE